MHSDEQIIQEIDEVRAFLTSCIGDARKVAEHIARGIGGREIALAITNLQQAGMWLRQASDERHAASHPTAGQQQGEGHP